MPEISPLDGPVAVTGCSGFTGGHMVRELVVQGYEVRACIRDANSWRGQGLRRLPQPPATGRDHRRLRPVHARVLPRRVPGLHRRLPHRRRPRQLRGREVPAAGKRQRVNGRLRRRHCRDAKRHRRHQRQRQRQASRVHEFDGRRARDRGRPPHCSRGLRVDGDRLGVRRDRPRNLAKSPERLRQEQGRNRAPDQRGRRRERRQVGRGQPRPRDDMRPNTVQGPGRPVDRTDRPHCRRPRDDMDVGIRPLLQHHRCPRPGEGTSPGGRITRGPPGQRPAAAAT